MISLSDEMDDMRIKLKKKRDTSLKKAKILTSSLPDPNMADEKKVAEMEKLCDRYQAETLVGIKS